MDTRSLYLKEMGIAQWSLRTATAAPMSNTESNPSASELEPKVYWLFYGEPPDGERQLLFQNMIRALGLLPKEWEWRIPSDIRLPNHALPCVAFAFGERAAQALSGEQEPIRHLRDTVLEIAGHDLPLVVSFDLAHYLSQPIDKRLLWQDLLLARSVLQSL